MAFQTIDPAPFIPNGYNRVEVPGREFKVRAFTRRNQ
jgi:hypothetical protein